MKYLIEDKVFFAGFYILLILNSIFLLSGVQNIFLEYVPIWNELYIIINVLIIVLCILAIYIMNTHQLKLAHIFLWGLFIIWIFYYGLVIAITLIFNVEGGMLYRNFWSLIFFWIFIKRLIFVRKLIKEEGRY